MSKKDFVKVAYVNPYITEEAGTVEQYAKIVDEDVETLLLQIEVCTNFRQRKREDLITPTEQKTLISKYKWRYKK